MTPPLRIAFLVFPRVTLLDLVGVYDGLRRVATMGIDARVTHRLIGTAAEITDDSGFALRPDGVYEDLAPFDLLIVPGGYGTRALADDARFLAWLATWGRARPVASVCTGALLLGRVGWLAGKRATTHASALAELAPLCGTAVADERIVDEGTVVTAGGVASSLDLGLYLVEKYWGVAARERIQKQMEYRGYAPR